MDDEKKIAAALNLIEAEEERIAGLLNAAGLPGHASLTHNPYNRTLVMVRVRTRIKAFMNHDNTRCDSTEGYFAYKDTEAEITAARERIVKKGYRP